MRKNLTKYRHLVLLVAAIQLAGTGLFPALHHDFEFWGGDSTATVSTHTDADHCRYVPLSEHSHCTICSTFQHRTNPPAITPGLVDVRILGPVACSYHRSSPVLHLLSPLSRRGPPSPLA